MFILMLVRGESLRSRVEGCGLDDNVGRGIKRVLGANETRHTTPISCLQHANTAIGGRQHLKWIWFWKNSSTSKKHCYAMLRDANYLLSYNHKPGYQKGV
jgi:hypothetical protein